MNSVKDVEPKPAPGANDEYVADLAAVNRLADEVFWEVFGQRGQETLQ